MENSSVESYKGYRAPMGDDRFQMVIAVQYRTLVVLSMMKMETSLVVGLLDKQHTTIGSLPENVNLVHPR